MKDNTTITQLHQPGTILDPLTEIAREGARQMLAAALRRKRRASSPGSRTSVCPMGASALFITARPCADDPDRDRPLAGAAAQGARPRYRRAGREEGPLHLEHPATASGSIVEAWVTFERFSPLKPTSALRGLGLVRGIGAISVVLGWSRAVAPPATSRSRVRIDDFAGDGVIECRVVD
uniref:hypothetical protein n=1 Tax=Paracoccus aminovorans TaxID=34004 RepID=UPI0018D570DF